MAKFLVINVHIGENALSPILHKIQRHSDHLGPHLIAPHLFIMISCVIVDL